MPGQAPEQRLAQLFDGGIWQTPLGPEEDGILVAEGTVNGKPVIAAAQDARVFAGTLGDRHGELFASGLRRAMEASCPFVNLTESGGARIQDGVRALARYGEIFRLQTAASGRIPQYTLALGACAGGAAYSPALSDFVFLIEDKSKLFLTGPRAAQAVTHVKTTAQSLGGARLHAEESGLAHVVSPDEASSFSALRTLIGLFPANNQNAWRSALQPDRLAAPQGRITLPPRDCMPYDMRHVICAIADDRKFFELQAHYAKSILTGFVRLGGATVGVVANQPAFMAGALDCHSSEKAARFVRLCDAFGVPILTLTDTPGYLPGEDSERQGVIRHGAKLLYAFCEATVPKVNLILRKAFGGGYIAMNSKTTGADAVLCFAQAQIAAMGEQAALEILYRKEAGKLSPDARAAFLAEKAAAYRQTQLNCRRALEDGSVDRIITPEETRKAILQSFCGCADRAAPKPGERKHGVMPL